MEKITQKPFENTKKISLDLNEEHLEIIDELAKLTKTNRTVVIGTLIGQGFSPFFRYLESTWKELLNNKNIDNKKKTKIQELLKDLKKIEITKWNPKAYD